jgi:hypothetical protein
MNSDAGSHERETFDVRVADDGFERFVRSSYGFTSSPFREGDEFIGPLFLRVGEHLSGYRLPSPPSAPVRLHLGIIEHPEPNAFAEWSDGAFYLAIHTGQLLSALEAAVQMQDSIGAFAQQFGVGSVSAGTPSFTKPLGVAEFLNSIRGVESDEHPFGMPHDPQNPATQRAMRFMSTAIQFALLHEFGHVVNGHLAWLVGAQCHARLREIPVLDDAVRPDLQDVLQFFEHEADVFALETLLRSAVQRSTGEDSLIIVMLAFLTTVLGWSVLDETPGFASGGSHPQAAGRLLALPMALIGVLEQLPDTAPQIQLGVQRCATIVKRVARTYPPFSRLEPIFSPSAVEQAYETVGWMRTMDRVTANRIGQLTP